MVANGVSPPMVKRHDREVDCTDKESTPPPYRNGGNKDDETRPQTTKTDNGKRTVGTSHDGAEDGTITLARVHSIAISLLCVFAPSSLGTENDNYMTPQSFVSRDNVDVQILPPTAILADTEKPVENINPSFSRPQPVGSGSGFLSPQDR